MRAGVISVLVFVAVVLTISLPGSVRSDGAVVPANDLYVATAWDDFITEATYSIEYSWSSDLPLSFTISKPSGFVEHFGTSTSGSGTVKTGGETVFFNWFNSNSENATLIYDLTTVTTVERTIWLATLGTIIGGVAVFVVIVVVVYFVVTSLGKSSRVSGIQQMPPAYPPVGGRCPSCGVPVDSDSRFCSKCGTRIG